MKPKNIITGLLCASFVLFAVIALIPAAAPLRAAVSGFVNFSSPINMNAHSITNAVDGVAGTDIVTKGYVDTASVGKTQMAQTFTVGGTWVKPSGVTQVWVTMCGGGAGGYSGGGSGGGSGQCYLHYPVTVAGNVSVTIGAGGATNSNGGNSSFGALTAVGGMAGQGGHGSGGGTPAGNGGSSGGGAGGAPNDVSALNAGGGGGGGYGGNGGYGGPGGGAGGNGSGYGSGGGGGGNTGGTGGAGTAGIVIVEWWQ